MAAAVWTKPDGARQDAWAKLAAYENPSLDRSLRHGVGRGRVMDPAQAGSGSPEGAFARSAAFQRLPGVRAGIAAVHRHGDHSHPLSGTYDSDGPEFPPSRRAGPHRLRDAFDAADESGDKFRGSPAHRFRVALAFARGPFRQARGGAPSTEH